MATVKKTRPAAKKAVPAKPASKKPVAKPISKPSVPAPKTSATKSKVVEKKKATIIEKKSAPIKPVAKSIGPLVSNTVKKNTIATKIPVKNSDQKEVAPSKKVVATKNVTVKTPAKTSAQAKTITSPVKSSKPVNKETAKTSTPASKSNTSAAKAGKPTNPPIVKQDDKLDPLHVKAAKAIKELSERMDLSKVRPRIQAGATPPAPKIVHRQPSQPLKLVEPTNTTKLKFQLEFEFRSSPKILYNYLYDSSGLAGWFADEVKSKDNLYTFIWEGGESNAKLIASKEQHLVRFQWTEETDGTYFQFEIKEDDLTGDVALVITDFANPGERDTNARLWESQVQKLRLLLGSF